MKSRAIRYATYMLSIFLFSAVGAILISAETGGRSSGELSSGIVHPNHPISDLEESAPASWEFLVENYLRFREESWPLVVPAVEGEFFGSWDSIIANVGKKIFMGWFWYFDDGQTRVAKGALPDKKDPKPYEVVIFEDIYTSRVIVLGMAEDERPIELYSQKVVPILESLGDGFSLQAEISMRRMAIRLTALPFNYIAPKQEIQLFDIDASSSFVPLRMMSSGYPADKIWLEINRHEAFPNDFAGLKIHAPTATVSRLDVFAHTDLLSSAPWAWICNASSLNAEGILAFTNDISNLSNQYYLATNADVDSDNDGIPDGQERFYYLTNPYLWDSDFDGMPDGWEVQYGLDPNDPGDADEDPDGDGFSNELEFELGAPPDNPAWNGAELVYSLQRVHEITNDAKATSYTSLRVDIDDSENCGGSAGTQLVEDPFDVPQLLDCGYFVELTVNGAVERNRSNFDHVFIQAYDEIFYFGGDQLYETDCGMSVKTEIRTNLVLPNSQVILRYDTVSFKYHKDAYAQVVGVRTTGVLKIEMPTNGLTYCLSSSSASFELGTGGFKPDDITWNITPSITGMGTTVSFNPNSMTSGEYTVTAESAEFPCVNTSCVVRIVQAESILPNFGQEIDDQDGNPNTKVFIVSVSNSGNVIVTAAITPNIPEDQLPACMTLQGGSGSERLTRTVSRATPSKTVFTFDCCGEDSGLITTLYVYETRIFLFSDEGSRLWQWPWDFNVGHAWWGMSSDSVIQELMTAEETLYANRLGGFWPSVTNDPFCPGIVKLSTDAGGGHGVTGYKDFRVSFDCFRAALSFFIDRHASPYNYDFINYNCTDAAVEQGEYGCVFTIDSSGDFTSPKQLSDWLNTH